MTEAIFTIVILLLLHNYTLGRQMDRIEEKLDNIIDGDDEDKYEDEV